MRMRTGLTLGGGGALGYAHIGVIRALEESGIPIHLINGSSMGAVIGGAYALYQDTGEITSRLEQILDSIDLDSFNIFRFREEAQPFLRNWLSTAICDISLLRSSVLSHKTDMKALQLLFGDHRFSDTKVPFSCVTVDLMSGRIIVIDAGRLVEGILPSISIPGVFPVIEREGQMLVDGSVLADVPVRHLREAGADFVIAVKIDLRDKPGYQTGFDILNYIETIKGDSLSRWEYEEADFQIEIAVPGLNLFEFGSYKTAIDQGYRIAKPMVPELRRRLSLNHG